MRENLSDTTFAAIEKEMNNIRVQLERLTKSVIKPLTQIKRDKAYTELMKIKSRVEVLEKSLAAA